MTLDDNHRSNTNSLECLHTYCSTDCVLEVRCNARLRTRSHISQITACWAGDHQQTGTGLHYCWPMCIKVQWHYTIGFRLAMTYVWKDTMSFIQVVWKGWLNTKRCIKPYHNRAANNTRQCTPTHNQPQSVKSQKGTWTHNKLLVLVNNCDYTNTALPAQPLDQWLATYVPPSSHVHVQYTTIATSHKTLLDQLDVRVQLQFKCTHLVTSSWI